MAGTGSNEGWQSGSARILDWFMVSIWIGWPGTLGFGSWIDA